MPTIVSFRGIENNMDVYMSKTCMKKFCMQAIKIINFKKKKTEVINKRAAGTI